MKSPQTEFSGCGREQILYKVEFRTWGFVDEVLKNGILGGGKQLHLGRPISTELVHQLPCQALDSLKLALVMSGAHMAQDFLSDLFASAHGFDDLDPGTIEFGIIFGAYEHSPDHS